MGGESPWKKCCGSASEAGTSLLPPRSCWLCEAVCWCAWSSVRGEAEAVCFPTHNASKRIPTDSLAPWAVTCPRPDTLPAGYCRRQFVVRHHILAGWMPVGFRWSQCSGHTRCAPHPSHARLVGPIETHATGTTDPSPGAADPSQPRLTLQPPEPAPIRWDAVPCCSDKCVRSCRQWAGAVLLQCCMLFSCCTHGDAYFAAAFRGSCSLYATVVTARG